MAVPGLAFVLIPLVALAVRAPWSDAASELTGPAARAALLVSAEVSMGATALSLLAGLPIAWMLARTPLRARAAVRAIVMLPMVLPPIVAGVGLLEALGRFGLLGGLLARAGITLPFTTAGATVAAAFVAMPFLVLSLESGLRALNPRLESAAHTLGASRLYALQHVTLPLLRPHLFAGIALAWARALGEFGATITFAGNLQGRTQTLPLAVFETLQTDPGGAVLLSVVMLVVAAIVLGLTGGRLIAESAR
ncbi:MAG: molybdate ABC transporter permease subunit [Actinomycetota bacterium]